MSWFEHLSHFEIAVLILLLLLLLGVGTAASRLAGIAKILVFISGQIERKRDVDLPTAIADGLEKHELRIERECEGDLPSGKDLYGKDWRPGR